MVVYAPGVSPSTAGFAIAFTIEVSLTMALSVRRYVSLEQGLNSVARIHSYSLVAKEPAGCEVLRDLPESWPQQGQIEVYDLVVRYAPNLPPVVKSVSFKAPPGTRVGVIGRTGAGKSSFVLALFRFLSAAHGVIMVDGVDISQVPLHKLCSRLAIIPQHPILFRGTVRSNLDLFDEYDDAALLAALKAVGWHGLNPNMLVESTTEGNASNNHVNEHLPRQASGCGILEQGITVCGENLSHGQRQLLCLARTIIRRPKIMILDEATASVDMATDDIIQRSLRSALGQDHTTTHLVIAHRLKTVADADTLLVLDNGRLVESGSPRELLSRDRGCFRGMVEQDPERKILERLIMGYL